MRAWRFLQYHCSWEVARVTFFFLFPFNSTLNVHTLHQQKPTHCTNIHMDFRHDDSNSNLKSSEKIQFQTKQLNSRRKVKLIQFQRPVSETFNFFLKEPFVRSLLFEGVWWYNYLDLFQLVTPTFIINNRKAF